MFPPLEKFSTKSVIIRFLWEAEGGRGRGKGDILLPLVENIPPSIPAHGILCPTF